MAQKGVQLDRETFSCSICLDLLKDPVTVSCGHSYCMGCIDKHWDREDDQRIYSCPQCRQTFKQRPALLKNTMLAVLVEELKKTGLQAAPADHCYAGAEDVACDVCSGRKCKAIKSCLICLVSFCESHIQPHLDSPAYSKHKLVEPSKKLQENICSRHNEVMKMFCRTDQQSICYLCSLDQHKDHDTVTAAAERTERQRELQGSRQNIQQRIQDRERDVKLLQQDVGAINSSADKAVEKSEKIFTELIRLLEQRRSDVKQQLRSQQEAEVSRVKELEEKLEQEIIELKSKDAELEKLSLTEDDIQFLQDYPSVSQLREPTDSASISERPLKYFEDVTAAVSELREKLQDVLRVMGTNISETVTQVDVLLSEPEPRTRAELGHHISYAKAGSGPGLISNFSNPATTKSGFGITATTNSGFGITATTNSGFGITATTNSGFGITATTNSGFGITATNKSGFGSSGFGNTATTNSGFGITATNKSGFGSSGFGNTATNNSGFGITATNKSGFGSSGFGNTATNNSGFGITATTKSGFGNTATTKSGFGNTATTNSGFGITATNKSGFGSSGFGNTATNNSVFGSSGFGITATTKSGFGSSGFGNTATTNSGFGITATNKSGFGSSGFGNTATTNSVFGSSGFGNTATTNSGFGITATNNTGFGSTSFSNPATTN